MRICTTALLGLLLAVACETAVRSDEPKAATTGSEAEVLADLYEHVANSIIEIRATEDNLVKAMLVQYHASAQRHLASARGSATIADRKAHFEAAAENIANIANEGDKRAQAVRQRLSDAGHYHQKDAETKEDYMFINSAEKKALFGLAKTIGQFGTDAAPADITKASEQLKSLFGKSIGRE